MGKFCKQEQLGLKKKMYFMGLLVVALLLFVSEYSLTVFRVREIIVFSGKQWLGFNMEQNWK